MRQAYAAGTQRGEPDRPRAHARVERYAPALPRKEPPSVPFHLGTALQEYSLHRERGGKSRLFSRFLAIRGVYLRLDTHESIRSAKERTRKL